MKRTLLAAVVLVALCLATVATGQSTPPASPTIKVQFMYGKVLKHQTELVSPPAVGDRVSFPDGSLMQVTGRRWVFGCPVPCAVPVVIVNVGFGL